MITDNIGKMIFDALKAKDEVTVNTLKLLSTSLHYEKIAKLHDLSFQEEISIVRREAKKRKEAIESLRQAQGKLPERKDELKQRLEKEQKELEILEGFLPQEISSYELEKAVEQVIIQTQAISLKDLGKVMGIVMSKLEGKANGSRVMELVKKKLE